MNKNFGPSIPISKELHALKYRGEGESFESSCNRFSSTLSDNDEHRHILNDILLNMRFLPAGRVQAAVGSPKRITPWNCFLSGTISDDFNDIMEKAKEAGHTMRLGGGIGYDFSTLRPRGSLIKSLGSQSSGPTSFMDIFDSVCGTISSAGHRRGAQMGVLRVDHPDIEEFIHAKEGTGKLKRFNLSVGVTDVFIDAVKSGTEFSLKFKGRIVSKVDARALWDSLMRSTWDWAEPGVLFIDRINYMNNLWYCENIAATNPCVPGETQILTLNGYQPIETLINQFVNIWNGSQWTKVKPFSTGYNPTVNVHLSDGSVFRCTPNHEFCLALNYKDSDRGDCIKIKASELKQGDMLAKFSMPIISGPEEYNIDPYSQGFYAGDGSKGYTFSFLYHPKFICKNRLIGTFSTGNSKRQVWRHGPMLDKEFVPVNGSIEYKLNWLAGLLDSDGTMTSDKNGSGFQITSVSKEFLINVKLMMTTLGCQVKIVDGNEAGIRKLPDGKGKTKFYQCQKTWRLLIGNTDSYSLYKLGLRTVRIPFTGRAPQRDARQYIKVISISESENCETFCFTDPLDGRGTFNGIVTGQCGEQPLPPYGACLLGSFNLVKYIDEDRKISYSKFENDIRAVVRAMDNIIDVGIYPLPQQEEEGKSKRRMGLGITGVANALERLGFPYGSDGFLQQLNIVLEVLRNVAYITSTELAKEKGAFPLFDKKRYLKGHFIETLPNEIRNLIQTNGIRNSHLLSIAPTGTISLVADNISSGIEPVYSHQYERVIQTYEGPRTEEIEDYAYRVWGLKGLKADQISVDQHVDVLTTSQKYIDSSVSKTCNVGDDVTWEHFKDIYMKAYDWGAKGCTTFRKKGKLAGILNETPPEEFIDDEDSVCRIDEVTGQPSCS